MGPKKLLIVAKYDDFIVQNIIHTYECIRVLYQNKYLCSVPITQLKK